MNGGGLSPLEPAATPVSATDLIAGLRLRPRPLPPGRPRVVAAMIGSADGRTAVAGRSVALGHPEDRALLRGLRSSADAVLVGAATVRAERYAKLFDGPERPPIAVLTRSGDVPWEVGMFTEPDTRILVYTQAAVRVPEDVRATVEVHYADGPGQALAHLRSHHVCELVLCEGGPRLLRAVAAGGLLDDLVLTVSPLLVAGEAPTALDGAALDPPVALELAGVWRAGDHLFAHYTA